VAGLAIATAVAAAAALALIPLVGWPGWFVWAVASLAAAAAAALAAIGWAAARPRLTLAGDRLEIRLHPLATERVPLDVVECVFRGTEPLAGGPADAEPAFRVGTLVVRFAERAAEWRSRETFRPWGTWSDGHAVIDGRWCEPLSGAAIERVAAGLIEAKRRLADGGGS